MTIKKKREELNLTQNILSEKTKIQTRVLQRIEKENYCSLKNAIRISIALKTPIEELFSNIYEEIKKE